MWPESVSKVLHNLYKKYSESHDLKPTKSHKMFNNFTSIDIRAHIKCPPPQKKRRKKSTPLIEPSLFWKTNNTGRHIRSRGSAGRSKNFVVASSCLLLAHGPWPRFCIFVCVGFLLFWICICIFILLFCICIWDFLWLPAVCSSVTAADPGFVNFADLCSLGQLPIGRSGDIFLIGGWCWNNKPWLKLLITVLDWQVRHSPSAQIDYNPFLKVKSCPNWRVGAGWVCVLGNALKTDDDGGDGGNDNERECHGLAVRSALPLLCQWPRADDHPDHQDHHYEPIDDLPNQGC